MLVSVILDVFRHSERNLMSVNILLEISSNKILPPFDKILLVSLLNTFSLLTGTQLNARGPSDANGQTIQTTERQHTHRIKTLSSTARQAIGDDSAAQVRVAGTVRDKYGGVVMKWIFAVAEVKYP